MCSAACLLPVTLCSALLLGRACCCSAAGWPGWLGHLFFRASTHTVPTIEVRGDAFLARVFDNGDDFERRDFLVAEVSSDAQWVRDAAAQHARQRAADTSGAALVERMRRTEEAAAATRGRVRELTPAEAAKEEGNEAFKRGDWQQAVECYTRALEWSPDLPAALNNRALALLKLQRWQDAASDCCSVLEREPHNVKALMRRAAAREALCEQPGAVEDLREVLRLEPRNKEAAAKLATLVGSEGAAAGTAGEAAPV